VKIERRWRDHGTGLSKSSVAKAINEAVSFGILVREKYKSGSGRDLSSRYAINWDRVQEYDSARRQGVSKRRTA
jgi:predicted transcriptional regulator